MTIDFEALAAMEARVVAASNRASQLHVLVPDLTVEEQVDALALIRGLSADLNALIRVLRDTA